MLDQELERVDGHGTDRDGSVLLEFPTLYQTGTLLLKEKGHSLMMTIVEDDDLWIRAAALTTCSHPVTGSHGAGIEIQAYGP